MNEFIHVNTPWSMSQPMIPGAIAVASTVSATARARVAPRCPVPYSSAQIAPSTMAAPPAVAPIKTMKAAAVTKASPTLNNANPSACPDRRTRLRGITTSRGRSARPTS